MSSRSIASSKIVRTLGGSLLSPSLPPVTLVSNMPLDSQPLGVSPSSTCPPLTVGAISNLRTRLLPNLPSTRSLSDFLLLSQSTVRPGRQSPAVFFTDALEIPEEKHMKLLISVVRGFSKVNGLPNEPRWSHIFPPKPEVGSKAESTPQLFHDKINGRLYRLK